VVEADVFVDGHDELACDVLWRLNSGTVWRAAPMEPLSNDRWKGEFPAESAGRYLFRIRATIDRYGTWLRDARIKAGAGQDLTVELLVGAGLLSDAAGRARGADRSRLEALSEQLRNASEANGAGAVLDAAGATEVMSLVRRHPDPGPGVTSEALGVLVERKKARFSTWYELFPRSASPEPGRHGTLSDVKARLDYVSRLGFDVLYLPPVHPIGRTNRKGRDGAREAGLGDPGSPWAIGGPEGGHTAVHPELGSIADLESLVEDARRRGIEVALDLAFQCSPDHPWVKENPEWFRWLPDGTVRYAENPPKRYEDIYPIDFDTNEWLSLWEELLEVVLFWVHRGILIFRVDNPHTKPLRFWEWLIAEVQAEHPDVLFLSEAFTRPKVMQRLAKAGFTQSYTYFAWRNTKSELEEYLTEVHRTELADFFRPNFWPNTPDILTEALQTGGRPAFMTRLVLAATSAASYGIYGPVFELCEHEPRTSGSEEYLHSEKYEIRHFDLEAPGNLSGFVARVNQIRHECEVLQFDRNLTLCPVDNELLLAYARTAPSILRPGTTAQSVSGESVSGGSASTRPETENALVGPSPAQAPVVTRVAQGPQAASLHSQGEGASRLTGLWAEPPGSSPLTVGREAVTEPLGSSPVSEPPLRSAVPEPPGSSPVMEPPGRSPVTEQPPTSPPSPTMQIDPRPLVVVVNLDPLYRQSGWVELDLESLGVDPGSPYEVHDLLTGARFQWQGPRNFVILDPGVVPAHILRIGGTSGEGVSEEPAGVGAKESAGESTGTHAWRASRARAGSSPGAQMGSAPGAQKGIAPGELAGRATGADKGKAPGAYEGRAAEGKLSS